MEITKFSMIYITKKATHLSHTLLFIINCKKENTPNELVEIEFLEELLTNLDQYRRSLQQSIGII